MSNNKEKFIEDVEKFIEQLSDEGREYFENILKKNKKESAGGITKKGQVLLNYMTENCEENNNIFTAKDIAADLNTTGRSVSSVLRKLVADGYLTKRGSNPICYSLTHN